MKKITLIYLSILLGTAGFSQVQENIASELVILNVYSGEEKIILRENRHFEAPNWSREGTFLLINAGGLLEKISLTGEKLGVIHEGIVSSANNSLMTFIVGEDPIKEKELVRAPQGSAAAMS